MSEQYDDDAVETEPVQGIGHMLREAREARGESIGDVAHALKLSVRQVEAIEQERFDQLPAGAFARGFVRNFARHLGLDPEAAVARMPGAAAPVQRVELAPLANADGTMPEGDGGRRALRPVRVLVIGMLIMLAAGWYFDWFRIDDRPAQVGRPLEAVPRDVPMPPEVLADAPDRVTQGAVSGESASPVENRVPQVASDAPPVARIDSTGGAAGAMSRAPEVQAAALAAVGASEATQGRAAAEADRPAGEGDTEARAPAPIEASTEEADPLPPGMSRLVFRLAGDSWIQVRDSDGVTLFTGIGAPGTERTVQGKAPFDLVVGNASKVELERDGVAVDLAPHARSGGVARLKLGQNGR